MERFIYFTGSNFILYHFFGIQSLIPGVIISFFILKYENLTLEELFKNTMMLNFCLILIGKTFDDYNIIYNLEHNLENIYLNILNYFSLLCGSFTLNKIVNYKNEILSIF